MSAGRLRPEMPQCFRRQFCLRGFAALPANAIRILIFSDMRFDGEQLGYLMPPRLTRCCHLPR